jgi:hypothetical protein
MADQAFNSNPYGDIVLSSQEESIERGSQGNKKRMLVKGPNEQPNSGVPSNLTYADVNNKRVSSLNSKNIISGNNQSNNSSHRHFQQSFSPNRKYVDQNGNFVTGQKASVYSGIHDSRNQSNAIAAMQN